MKTRVIYSFSILVSVFLLTINTIPFAPIHAQGSSDASEAITAANVDRVINTEILAIAQPRLTSNIESLALSPDSTLLATSEGNAIRFWNPQTGALLASLPDSNAMIYMRFSQDGKQFAASSQKGMVRIYDPLTGAQTTVWDLQKSLTGITLNQDFTRAAYAEVPQKTNTPVDIHLWDTTTQTEAAVLKGHNGFVNKLVFSADGSRLASASLDKTARLWDAKTGEQLASLDLEQAGQDAAFSTDGKLLAVSAGPTVQIWDTQAKTVIDTVQVAAKSIQSLVFSAHGTQLVFTAEDQSAYRYDLAAHKIETLYDGGSQPVPMRSNGQLAVFDANSSALYAVNGPNVRAWTSAQEPSTPLLRGWGVVTNTVFSADGMWLVSADGPNLRVWDLASQRMLLLLDNGSSATKLALHPDGTTLAATAGNSVNLWNIRTGQLVKTLKGLTGEIKALRFNLDGSQLATVSADGTAATWDSSAGTQLNAVSTRDLAAWANAEQTLFSPDLSAAVSLLQDKIQGQWITFVWDVKTGKEMYSFPPALIMPGIAFSPDGALLAFGSTSSEIHLIETKTGNDTRKLETKNDPQPIAALTFSSDGNLLTVLESATASAWHI
jgi:WD40 repeat protein